MCMTASTLLICDDSSMARKQLLRALPADWPVAIEPEIGVAYEEIIDVVDILIESNCTDIRFTGSAFESDEDEDEDEG